MKSILRVALALALFPSLASAGTVGMGDSLTDEYQFPIFTPAGGDRRTAKNYVELLSELRPADFDFGDFSAASRGTPRNQGFEYNWGRDGATSAEVIAEGQHTGAAGLIPQPFADAVAGAIGTYNQQLALAFAGNDRVAVADLDAVIEGVMAGEQFTLGGVAIDRTTPGSEPNRLFVDSVHPGTVGQGLIANAFLTASNERFGTEYQLLSDAEILDAAGAGPTPIPLPAGGWAALGAAPVVYVAARRRRAAA